MASGFIRQCTAAAAALLSVISSATCLGWITPILVDLLGPDSEVSMTESESSWMISVIEIGNLISPIPAGILGDRWGRKPCILATGPIYFICWIIVLTTNTVEALYVVRILQGTMMGLVLTIVPVYLAEIASPNVRGTVTSLLIPAWYFGYLFESCVGPFLSYRMFTVVTAVWPILQILLFFWQPESPYFLLMNGRDEEAKESLSKLRMLPVTDRALVKELEEIQTTLEGKETSPWASLFKSPSDRRNLFVTSFVGFVMMLSGGNALLPYSSHLFSSTKLSFLKPDHVTIVILMILFLSSFFSSVFVDRIGRRPLLIISTIGSTLSLLSCTSFLYLQERHSQWTSQYFVVYLFSLLSYFVFWTFGLVPVFVTYQSELFLSNMRGTASSIIASINTVFAFINLKSYSPISERFGLGALFGYYTTICFIGFVVLYLLAPETKGKSLSEIQICRKDSVNLENHELHI